MEDYKPGGEIDREAFAPRFGDPEYAVPVSRYQHLAVPISCPFCLGPRLWCTVRIQIATT